MYFHGINYEYLLYQYPVLSPRLTILRQNKQQHQDRKHLLEQFGFEPVHFLENSPSYRSTKCLESCFKFGDVVLVFDTLPMPMLQLSEHELGVPVADTRKAKYIFIKDFKYYSKLKKLFPKVRIIRIIEKKANTKLN